MNEKNPETSTPIIGISIGDINGIGPEVTIKALSDSRITSRMTPLIYASGGLISYYRKALDQQRFSFNQVSEMPQIAHKQVNVLNVWSEKIEIEPGRSTPTGGIYAKKSLDKAVADLKEGKIHALVTAPISKEEINKSGFEFPGHTEFLSEAFGGKKNLMLMVDGDLRVGVVTGHIPLKAVSSSITAESVKEKLTILINSLKDDFRIKKPRVALLGLNPHAGENGLLGNEENDVLMPVINEFKENGHLIFGPYPADGFFGGSQFRQFDGILAMYHDQGLIPFKYISGGHGVNFTAGLPVIRTSPAHGTAFSIAGKNEADPASMRSALYLALDLIRNKSEIDY